MLRRLLLLLSAPALAPGRMLRLHGIVGIRVSIGPDSQPGQTPDDFPAFLFQSLELVARDADGDVI